MHAVTAEVWFSDGFDAAGVRLMQDGSRSLLFVFRPEPTDEPVELGAVVTNAQHLPRGLMTCELRFWADVAEIYAQPGAAFDLWYSQPVGGGVVGAVLLDELLDE